MTVLTDLDTIIRTRLGNPSTDGFFTTAQVTDLTNEALLAISAEADWPWQQAAGTDITTASGTATYTISDTGYTRTRVLVIDGYQPLDERSLAEIRGMPTSDTGQPLHYAIENLTLHLRPVPDGTYTIKHHIVKSEAVLSGSATPLIPSMYYYAVAAKATELAHLRQRDTERAQAARAEYNAWLKRMQDNLRRTASPKRIRVRPGSGL